MRRLRVLLAWVVLGAACAPPCWPQPAAGGARLISPYREYALPLTSFAPAADRVAGVLLKTRINGGPVLHLLLDSGAEQIAIDRKAAAKSALQGVSDFLLVGAGDSPTRTAAAGIAERVEMGPVAFANCPVEVVRGRVADGLDGVIPVSLFRGFLVRLDLPARTLALTPYPEGAPIRTAGFSATVPNRNLLLTKAALDDAREGYVLLDTGAAYTGISLQTARALRSRPVESFHMQGGAGPVAGEMVEPGIRFRIADQELTADHPVAVDLTAVSRYNGVEMIGVLGYPELRNTVLTVNYRDALVGIECSSGRSRRAPSCTNAP